MSDKNIDADITHNALKSNKSEGTIELYGFKLNVGKDVVAVADSAIGEAQSLISQYGAPYLHKWTSQTLRALGAPQHIAEQAGFGATLFLRYGAPLIDIGGAVKTAFTTGHHKMSDLGKEASAVFAANSGNAKAGVGGMLTTQWSTLRYERQLVADEAKNTVLASATKVIRNLPGMVISYWQQQKEFIKDPDRVFKTLPPENEQTKEAWDRAREKYAKLKEMQVPGSEKSKASSKDKDKDKNKDKDNAAASSPATATEERNLFDQLLHPKDLHDIEQNLKADKYAPLAGVILSRLIGGHIQKKNYEVKSTWRKIQDLKLYIKKNEPTSGSEISSRVSDIFQQHATDLGIKDELAGSKFKELVEKVSDAIVNGMTPDALVELLDNKQVIVYDQTVTYGKISDIETALYALGEKYAPKVNAKEFYKTAPFTKEEALQAFKNLDDEEKPFYASLFERFLLEEAGANAAEVAELRTLGQQNLVNNIVNIVGTMLDAGTQALRESGIPEDTIDELQSIGKDFKKAVNAGRADEFVRKKTNKETLTEILRNSAVTAGDNFWRDYVGSRNSGEEEKSFSERVGRQPEEEKSFTERVPQKPRINREALEENPDDPIRRDVIRAKPRGLINHKVIEESREGSHTRR